MKTKPWQSKQHLYQEVLKLKDQHSLLTNVAISRVVGLTGRRIGLILKNHSGVM
jgi:hypothetical protein